MKRSPNISGKGVLITVFAFLEAERNVKLNALENWFGLVKISIAGRVVHTTVTRKILKGY